MSSGVIGCHLMSSDVICCNLLSSVVICCHLLSSVVICCHLMSLLQDLTISKLFGASTQLNLTQLTLVVVEELELLKTLVHMYQSQIQAEHNSIYACFPYLWL